MRKLTVAVVLAATRIARCRRHFQAGGVVPAGRLAPRAPQVELIFARGRIEPPAPDRSATPCVSALRNKTDKNIDLYAVNYPADTEIDIGANDMSPHVQYTMANCPDTRLVLGGYSLGAAVTDVVLAVPFAAFGFKNPLPPGADQHIAAVALFGNGIAVGRARSRTSTRSTASGPSSCATATTRSATPPTRRTGRTTGPTTWRRPTSTPAWSTRPPTSWRAGL